MVAPHVVIIKRWLCSGGEPNGRILLPVWPILAAVDRWADQQRNRTQVPGLGSVHRPRAWSSNCHLPQVLSVPDPPTSGVHKNFSGVGGGIWAKKCFFFLLQNLMVVLSYDLLGGPHWHKSVFILIILSHFFQVLIFPRLPLLLNSGPLFEDYIRTPAKVNRLIQGKKRILL